MRLILIVAALATVTCLVSGQEDSCISPTGADGRCISLNDCEKIKKLTKGSISDREVLKQWHCGFIGEVPMVCCPNKAPIVTTIESPPDGTCVTIEGTIGTCVVLEACPNVAKKLMENKEDSLRYVLGSRCLGSAPFSVCCETPTVTNVDSQTTNMCSESPGLPEPSGDCCSEDSGFKIIQGSRAYIEQYPWMAILEYSDADYECTGSLISSQYVLTAAHCIMKSSKKFRRTRSVRLGDFDATNSGRDCIVIEGGGLDCTTGDISILVAAMYAHPDYRAETTLKAHDIALIKLNEMAPYNDFIRPICLPTSDVTKSLSPYDYTRFFVSGWGPVDQQSNVKLHIVLPYVNETRCQQIFGVNGQTVWDKICAGETHKDRCKGQPGGPLMFYNGRKYELAGVISSDAFSCLTMHVSTNVYDYLPWIKSIINS